MPEQPKMDTIRSGAANAPADVSVNVSHDEWKSIRDAEAVVVRAAQATAAFVSNEEVEVSVALSCDAEIQILNARYRNQNKPTNVLSFTNGMMLSATYGPVFLGDVIIAYETLICEAAAEGKYPADHLAHLTVHGVLHLLGFDHENDKEAERMEAAERTILNTLGVSDPYDCRLDAVEPEAA